MSADRAPIRLLRAPLSRPELARFVGRPFPDMIKFVVDVERGVVALGGELHADAESRLLEDGSRQEHLWGGNYYPGLGEGECVEYAALINVRPAQGNMSMAVQDPALRDRMRRVVFDLVGRGEALP